MGREPVSASLYDSHTITWHWPGKTGLKLCAPQSFQLFQVWDDHGHSLLISDPELSDAGCCYTLNSPNEAGQASIYLNLDNLGVVDWQHSALSKGEQWLPLAGIVPQSVMMEGTSIDVASFSPGLWLKPQQESKALLYLDSTLRHETTTGPSSGTIQYGGGKKNKSTSGSGQKTSKSSSEKRGTAGKRSDPPPSGSETSGANGGGDERRPPDDRSQASATFWNSAPSQKNVDELIQAVINGDLEALYKLFENKRFNADHIGMILIEVTRAEKLHEKTENIVAGILDTKKYKIEHLGLALENAAGHGYTRILSLLLETGDCTNGQIEQALMKAARSYSPNRQESVELLVGTNRCSRETLLYAMLEADKNKHEDTKSFLQDKRRELSRY